MIAKVIMLDQFTRNVYRGSPKAFAGDAEALRLANALMVPPTTTLSREEIPRRRIVHTFTPENRHVIMVIQDMGAAETRNGFEVLFAVVMPVMHSESLADHRKAEAVIAQLVAKAEKEEHATLVGMLRQTSSYMAQHTRVLEVRVPTHVRV